MEKTFLFVDSTGVDNATRKSMRRHVMTGKNAGKTLHRSSRLDLVRTTPYNANDRPLKRIPRVSNNKRMTIDVQLPCPVVNHRSLGNFFLSLSFPLELTRHSLKVINQHFNYVMEKLYPCQLGLSIDQSKYTWLHVLLSDKAAFHCTISALQATNELLIGEGASTPETLYHLSRALTLLKERLDKEDAMSDSTLAVIIMLIIQEQMRNGIRESQVHYEGLRKIIELRGGLDQFERNPPLLLKICKMDIGYALQQGRSIYFSRDRMAEVLSRLASTGFNFDRISTASLVHCDELNPHLHPIFSDAMSVASLFNNMPANRSIDIHTFQELQISIFSRLSQFPPLQDLNQLPDIDAVYHLGLTIFMLTILFRFNMKRILEFDPVIKQLQNILDRRLDGVDDHLLLWFLFVAGMWTRSSANGSCVIPRIRTVSQRLGINTWAEVYEIVSRFPWITTLHNEPGRAVWDSPYQTLAEL